MRKTMKTVVPLTIVMFFLASGGLMAQTGVGIRAGVTADPNQFHFGMHFVTDPLFPHFTFRPNLEVGVGSHVTTIAANFEFAYGIPIPKSEFSAYLGAGPSLNIYRFSEPRGNNTETGGGFNVLVGLEHRRGLFGELKVGALDSPNLKFTIGFTFR